nr:glutamate-cysteine ligase family protein [Streptomyces sp. SID3343]
MRLQPDALASLFTPPAHARERIGLEVETGVVDPRTGHAAPYEGPTGVKSILHTVLAEWGGQPRYDTDHLTAVHLPEGGLISVEHGGQLEYSGAPAADLAGAVDDARAAMQRLADVAERFGLALLPGAYLPFDRPDAIRPVPMSRGPLMREHFAALGPAGSRGDSILALSTSTQTHLDYLSPDDFTFKLRMQMAASTVVNALFVNSPLHDGAFDGVLSQRSQAWLYTDPRRCGPIPPALRPDVTVDNVIDWALTLPMIYYVDGDGRHRPAPDRPFAAIMQQGFDDATTPTLEHWAYHLGQILTHVRVRRTLELRSADGPPYPHISALPALWVGLSYHPASCAAAWELLSRYTLQDHRTATARLPRTGLDTLLGGDRLHELALELVRLARSGLEARVAAGVENPKTPHYLDPLDDILHTGNTFAHQSLQRWEGDFARDPGRYVAAFRV